MNGSNQRAYLAGRLYLLAVVTVLFMAGGCAKDIHKPVPTDTLPVNYQSYTCDQLETTFSTIGRAWKEVSEIPGKAVEISLLTEAKAVISAAETKNCQLMLRDLEKANEETENINGVSTAVRVCIAIGTAAMFLVMKRSIRKLVNIARNTCLSLSL